MILNPYYTVYVAERGAEAVEMLSKLPVDLVTLDLKMPDLSGIHGWKTQGVRSAYRSHHHHLPQSQDTAISGLGEVVNRLADLNINDVTPIIDDKELHAIVG